MQARPGSLEIRRNSIHSCIYQLDGGTSWHASGGLAECDQERHYGATGLAIDPRNPEVLFAAGTFGVFRSTDAGAHWTVRTTGYPLMAWH